MSKYSRLFFCTVSLTLCLTTVQGQDAQNQNYPVNYSCFIENRGQWPAQVKYLCRINGLNAWITEDGVVYDYYQITRDENAEKTNRRAPNKYVNPDSNDVRIHGHVVRTLLQGANAPQNIMAKAPQDGYYNYFIGNDPAQWANFVNRYEAIEIKGVYPGIDIRYYYDRGQLRYDYQVAAGADPSQIQFRLEGADGYQVNAEGELLIQTSLGEVRHGKLRAYQEIHNQMQDIACRFESKSDGTLGIHVRTYDTTQPLIIDPLVYSTFLGGSGIEMGNSIAIDNKGNAYITGNTPSTNFPTTTGAYDVSQNGNMDVFVTRLVADGATLVYSTFLGGANLDQSNAIALNGEYAFITGYTGSNDYPTTSGAYDRNRSAISYDAFVTKLNASGSALLFSTFLGGSSTDNGISISFDRNANAIIAGVTSSNDFPTSSTAFDKSYNGNDDVFVTKLNFDGSALTNSTYLGGTSYDVVYSLALDSNGYPCVTGETTSGDYPITSGAYDQTTDGLYRDVFVTKLNNGGSALVFSTFLGGSSHDWGYAVAFDANRNVYVTGGTYSSNFPTTAGAYSQTYHTYDVFVTKLNYAGGYLEYSTFIGGSGTDAGHAIAVDNSGNAYITGATTSTNYPTTSDAFDQSYNGGDWDIFVTKLNASGSTLDHSTFIGGATVDICKSIAIDNSGNAYLTGYTTSSNYPTTSGAFDQSYNGNNSDVFVTKLSLATPDIASVPIAGSYGSVNIGSHLDLTFTIRNEGNGDLNVSGTTLTSTDFSIQSGGGVFTLAPAATHDMVVRFSPTSAGYKFAALNISSNDPDENPFQVQLSGNGIVPTVPDIASNPKSWSFGAIDIGSYAEKTFVISNEGNADLNVTATTLAGPVPAEYSLQSGGGAFTLAPAAARNIVVRFSPANTGDRNAILNISSNDPDENPFQIQLGGYGTSPSVPDISANPTSWNYGNVTVGNYLEKTIVIKNDGTANLNVTATSLTGTNATEFSISSGGGAFTLAASATRDLIIRFTPASAGSKSASLSISSNDPDENPFLVNLTGAGTAPATLWETRMTVAGSATFVRTFGGATSATDGYDPGLDVAAAPPAMTYYVYFPLSTFPNYLEKDIRQWQTPYDAAINWPLTITNASGVTSNLSWNPAELPAEGSFWLTGGGLNVNLRTRNTATVSGNVDLVIKYQKMITVTYTFAKAGWYLISLPLTPADNHLNILFPTAIGAYSFNSATGTYLTVTQLEPKKGYWLLIPGAATATVSGEPLLSYTEHYHTGWHLIGASAGASLPIADPDDTPNGAVIAIYGWNPATNTYTAAYPPGSGILNQGEGYWLAAITACDLTIPGAPPLARNMETVSADLPKFYQQYGMQPPPPPLIQHEALSRLVPIQNALLYNYPNPFNPTTTIEFQFPGQGMISLAIYDLQGHKIRTLLHEMKSAGRYAVNWDGRDEAGHLVASGIYFYKLWTNKFSLTKKCFLLK